MNFTATYDIFAQQGEKVKGQFCRRVWFYWKGPVSNVCAEAGLKAICHSARRPKPLDYNSSRVSNNDDLAKNIGSEPGAVGRNPRGAALARE
jgi:hypothetical protein